MCRDRLWCMCYFAQTCAMVDMRFNETHEFSRIQSVSVGSRSVVVVAPNICSQLFVVHGFLTTSRFLLEFFFPLADLLLIGGNVKYQLVRLGDETPAKSRVPSTPQRGSLLLHGRVPHGRHRRAESVQDEQNREQPIAIAALENIARSTVYITSTNKGTSVAADSLRPKAATRRG